MFDRLINMLTGPKEPPDEQFRNYLLQEYAKVAEAHFKTIETISAFFKHYLIIMTLPLALIGFLIKSSNLENEMTKVIQSIAPIGGVLLLIIAIAGSAVMIYIMNLRFDAILYARTVNGIRKYFYDKSGVSLDTQIHIRVLPQTATLPHYFEGWYFLPVIVVFALMDSLYYYLGIHLIMFSTVNYASLLAFDTLIFTWLHFHFYCLYAVQRERSYLKSHIIGLDIDGVLNKHREHFCHLLFQKAGISIEPEKIDHIPVHESDSLNIKKEDADKVFNSPEYWTDMPKADFTPENIRRLRNIFQFKISIFSYRPWPSIKIAAEEWRKCLLTYEERVYKEKARSGNLMSKLNLWFDYNINYWLADRLRRESIINRMTVLWLRLNDIDYDELIIEKGSEEIPDPVGLYKNRSFISKKKKIRFFVEDDLEKAVKLAYICDVVFLMSHPYNKPKMPIPSNIVISQTWNEVYRNVRHLL